MNDFSKITQHGWLGRIGGAVKGMIAGLVLLIVALGLQFWNEGRTLQRNGVLSEARASVESVAAATPSASFEGRLVHVGGEATATTPVTDEAFGVNVSALALRRRVEMYQWHEKRERKEEKQLGGGTRTVTQYRYEQRWDDDAEDSSGFDQASTHVNPDALPFEDETRHADKVRLGGFVLAPEVAREIDGWKAVAADKIVLPPNLAVSFRAAGEWFTTSADPEQPVVGDVRVRFDMVPAGPVSVIARQVGSLLTPQVSARGDALVLVERGEHSAKEMLDDAGSRNNKLSWVMRAVGFGLAWLGLGLLFKPLVVMADVVPVFGRLAGFGAGVVSALLAALISLVGIGSGWLWYRPWALGLILIPLVAGAVWWVRRKRVETPPPFAASGNELMPPPPPPPPPMSSPTRE